MLKATRKARQGLAYFNRASVTYSTNDLKNIIINDASGVINYAPRVTLQIVTSLEEHKC